MAEQVRFIKQDFQYVPMVSAFGYQRIEVVEAKTLVDGWQDREMVYDRYTFDETVSGDFDEILFEIPFGCAVVSGA